MRKLVPRILLILFVLGLCAWYVFPPKERLRLGKDLRGGVSMVYTVKIPEGADRQSLLAQVVEVLKDRVNPQGVLDISIVPQGLDRIEVVMPLPSPEVRELQTAYANALDSLMADAQITEADLEELLRSGTVAQRFGAQGTVGGLATELQETYNRARDLRRQLAEAGEQGADQAAIEALEAQIAQTELAEERLRKDLLALSIDQGRLVRALGLSREPQAIKDAQGVITGQGPSPREVELSAIKAEFPHLAERIDALVAAHDAYADKRKTLDDPEDLKRVLRGAGVLQFHIAVNPGSPEGVNPAQLRQQLAEVGPSNVDSSVAGWFKINKLEQWYETPEQLAMMEADPVAYFANRGLVAGKWQDDIYLLLYTSPSKSLTHSPDRPWAIERVSRVTDELGRPAVSFALDPSGGTAMGRLTGPHVGQQMAIVLDGQVYSAPVLQSAISSSGQITGNFSDAELSYLVRVLAAGALEARLSPEPISTSILGPSLGADNLRRGLRACLISLIAIGALMTAYYFFAGVIAMISLACTAALIFGVMAMIDSSFTLPGLAGVALTISMAVDCNVLLYERMREEMMDNGEDLSTAVRIAFKRVFNAIIDGQLTNLIVCVVLVRVATAEVKGFGVTMIIGVLATLFTALVITQTLFVIYADVLKFKSLPMLPTVFPAVHRLLEPKVDWIGKRRIFFTASAIICALGLLLTFYMGRSLLDTEFRGGVSLTMSTRLAGPGEPAGTEGRLLLPRQEVEARVRRIGEENADDPILAELARASVLTLGDVTPEVEASTFQIKVSNPTGAAAEEDVSDVVTTAVIAAFQAQLDAMPALRFAGADDPTGADHTFPIEKERLGDNILRPQFNDPVGPFLGGVAIVVDDISPPVTRESVERRVNRMRQQPDFAGTVGRETRVVGLTPAVPGDPSQGYTSIAVLVRDPEIDARKVELSLWDEKLAQPEWKVLSQALGQPTSLDQVSSFSAAVARTLSAQAVVAIVLSVLGIVGYVWFRFASLRYSVAAILAVMHDVIVALAAVALTHFVADTAFGRALLLEPFRIDLNVVAGILTLIGYSLNDTIVIMDRIRENRGKLPLASARIVNLSINQTMSRTVLTTLTTLMAAIILYVEGGGAIRPFSFLLIVGLITGTYSTVAIAAPMVWTGDTKPETPPATASTPATLPSAT